MNPNYDTILLSLTALTINIINERKAMQNRSAQALQAKVQNKITEYLTHDNPPPPPAVGLFSQLSNFFQSWKSTGRTRANNYLIAINNFTHEINLLKKIADDVLTDGGTLGTSKLLRIRLASGICEYLNIPAYNNVDQLVSSYINKVSTNPTVGINIDFVKLEILKCILLDYFSKNKLGSPPQEPVNHVNYVNLKTVGTK